MRRLPMSTIKIHNQGIHQWSCLTFGGSLYKRMASPAATSTIRLPGLKEEALPAVMALAVADPYELWVEMGETTMGVAELAL